MKTIIINYLVANHVLTVESKSRGHPMPIGMEMNEQKAVTLVVFKQEDSTQRRQLKELIIDMTQKDPKKRIDMQEVCTRLKRESMNCCQYDRLINDETNFAFRLKLINDPEYI